MTVSTRLLITRHGEAAYNVAGIVGGDIGCTGLTTCGREQVARLGARLAAEQGTDPFDVLYAGPRLRAQQSAQILAGVLRIESITDPTLVGPDHGEADGMAWNDVKTAFTGPPQAYPHLAHAPGAETWLAYLARTFSSLTHLLDLHAGQKILIAAHSETIKAANTLLLELPRPGWAELCDRTLTYWSVVDRYPTRRPASDVWSVRDADDKRYVVKQRISRVRHDREIHAYRRWTGHLDGHAPALLATDSKTMTIILDAAAGTSMDHAVLGTGQQQAAYREAGHVLRLLHSGREDGPPAEESALTEGSKLGHPATRLRARFEHWLVQARPQLNSDDLAVLTRVADILSEPPDLPATPCHLDYQPHNGIISTSSETGPRLCVIDFEHSRMDVAVRDLVRLETRCWPGSPELREAFFDGYGRQPDDAHEVAMLRACTAIDAVSSLACARLTQDASLTEHGRAALAWLRSRESRSSPAPASRSTSFTASAARLVKQLDTPDASGRDLELFRTRSYRFSDDPHLYVLAESLQDRFLRGVKVSEPATAFVGQSLDQLRRDGTLPCPDIHLIANEGIDLDRELLEREPFAYTRYEEAPGPDYVVAVVGAPRSGTSHLVNLLAGSNQFAYFTTASCWAWPIRNLRDSRRVLFSRSGAEVKRKVLAVDNKRTRIMPGLVMPGEAEDVYARAIPVYRHLGGHSYAITQASVGDLNVLRTNCAAHLHHFQRCGFLTKSPFNSLRIAILELLWPGKVRYIHIARDRDDAADSMRRNAFEFYFDGKSSAEHSWERFVDAVQQTAPAERLLTVAHADVTRRPGPVVAEILAWLGRS